MSGDVRDVERYLDDLNLARLEQERSETLHAYQDSAPATFSKGSPAPNIPWEDAELFSAYIENEEEEYS